MGYQVDFQKSGRRTIPVVVGATGIWLPIYGLLFRLRRLPAVVLMGLSSRSRVAALAERRCSLTAESGLIRPCRSMESTKLDCAALSRFSQLRSEAYQITTTASRTASSWMHLPTACLPLLSAVPPSSLMQCLRWWPCISENSSSIPPMSFFCAYWNRYRIVATSSCFTILKMRPPTWLPPAVFANPLIEATTFVE